MAPPAKALRTMVVGTSRDMVALVVGACVVTFGLAYLVHSRPDAPEPRRGAALASASPDPKAIGGGAPAQGWTGQLADVAPTSSAAAQPMTSASLVVSPSQLPPVGPARTGGKRACEGAPCAVRTAGASPARPVVGGPGPTPLPVARAVPRDRGWPANVDALAHLLDTATLKQPFTYVGDKVAGWFK